MIAADVFAMIFCASLLVVYLCVPFVAMDKVSRWWP